MNCPRCALAVRVRADYLKLERCPRCLARAGVSVPLYESDTPEWSLAAQEIAAAPVDRPQTNDTANLMVDRGGNHERQVLALRGEFDIAGALEFARCVRGALSHAPKLLQVDLRGLTFIDSSGLRAILNTARLCERRGCELVLIEGAPAVQRAFATAGLAASLKWHGAPAADRSVKPRSETA